MGWIFDADDERGDDGLMVVPFNDKCQFMNIHGDDDETGENKRFCFEESLGVKFWK
jgi:hypothetical protein